MTDVQVKNLKILLKIQERLFEDIESTLSEWLQEYLMSYIKDVFQKIDEDLRTEYVCPTSLEFASDMLTTIKSGNYGTDFLIELTDDGMLCLKFLTQEMNIDDNMEFYIGLNNEDMKYSMKHYQDTIDELLTGGFYGFSGEIF